MTLFETAPSIQTLLERATAAFVDRFGSIPSEAAAAPGRVNLIGEHTDYSGGFVLPMAIDRACVAVGALSEEPDESALVALDLEEEVAVLHDRRIAPAAAAPAWEATGRPPPSSRGGWGSYMLGVMAGFEQITAPEESGRLRGVNMLVVSSVPFGGGLSSSASLEVATATLLEALLGVTLAPRDKALLCQKAEHEFAGVPCGIMDQLVSTMGREGHALLIDCRNLNVTPTPMPPAEGNGGAVVLVANSNVHHALAAGEYGRRRLTTEAAARALGVDELRDATLAAVEGSDALTDEQRRCARHVVSENERTVKAAEALRRGDLEAFGQLMNLSHDSLRDDFRVSCAELDTLVELARGCGGVYGARMTGGGFGGCTVALVDTSGGNGALERAAERLLTGYRHAHGRDCTLYVTTAQAGARVLDA